MPRFDRMGPFGAGPMTGRGFGPCGLGLGWHRGFGFGKGLGKYFGAGHLIRNKRVKISRITNKP